jgi:cyanophycin synthetase
MGVLAGKRTVDFGDTFFKQYIDRFQSLKTFLVGGPVRREFIACLSHDGGLPIEMALLEAIRSVELSILAAAHSLDRVDFTAVNTGPTTDTALLIWETHFPKLSRIASDVAFAGLAELLPTSVRPQITDTFDDALAAAIELAMHRRLSPTSAVLRHAAKLRGLAVEKITGQHLLIGHGVQQHRLYASMTGFTSISATKLAGDKRQTNRRLKQLRLPVPEQVRVESAARMLEAVRELGGKAVIKPQKGSRGGGVTAGVEESHDLEVPFKRAAEAGSGVLAERFMPGVEHRLLVIGGQFRAALIRVPPTITGDGERTVQELIDELNTDPYRDGFRLFQIRIDDAMQDLMNSRGYLLNTIPQKGDVIPLRTTSNVSTGGVPIDVTDDVHPDNKRMAENAANGIGLDVAGVDFVTTDIKRSYRDVGGGILEVNARPGLCMHTWPREGTRRNVAGAIVELVVPKGKDGTVPKLVIVGDHGAGSLARATEHHLGKLGQVAGLLSRDTARLGKRCLDLNGKSLHHMTKTLLLDPRLEALVTTTSIGRIVKRGLGLENCDAVAILPSTTARTSESFRLGIDILVRANQGRFVIWSDDAANMKALQSLAPNRIVLVARSADDDAAALQIRCGGPAVIMNWDAKGSTVTLYDRGKPQISAPLELGDEARCTLSPRDLEDRIFAMALAYAGGNSATSLQNIFRQFEADVTTS